MSEHNTFARELPKLNLKQVRVEHQGNRITYIYKNLDDPNNKSIFEKIKNKLTRKQTAE
ncbi:MAG TPA: hypothetical protein ACFCUY_14660 [Xenococcaceae cyanobacterium]|jgi:RNA binding exosome subunit